MRQAQYQRSFAKLKDLNSKSAPDVRTLLGSVEVDLSRPCIILGGKNGAGKSRVLKSISEQDDVNGVFLDLHHLIEQALIILRSREDFDAMSDEYQALNLKDDTVTAVNQIVGRNYSSISWFSLELESYDPEVTSSFRWGGDQSLYPYFRVEHKGISYTSRDMGLGEFSVHFLLWILEQYRESKDITLLLDEPDAYLPPVGVSILLYHLVDLCISKKWKLVVSTHSEEMIRLARRGQIFTLLRTDDDGQTTAIHSTDHPRAGDSLLSFGGVRRVLFCEDESAYVLTRVLLQVDDLSYLRETTVVWGDGFGYLNAMRPAMPKPPKPDIEFAYVYDGDQRDKQTQSEPSRWPAVFLPTNDDPDSLFMSLANHLDELASALSLPPDQLREVLDTLSGKEQHDWVNDLCAHFGRPNTLAALAALWCQLNESLAAEFVAEMHAVLPPHQG